MLKTEDLDFVVIATPTYLHAEITKNALGHGVHVFCEKPMAYTVEQAESMIDAARNAGKKLMIGQCLRFWPAYVKLKEYIDSGAYGKVNRADFTRLSSTPLWSWQNWYLDHEKSGGAALDLHVHDVDMVNWLFGAPEAVYSTATHAVTKFDSITTNYKYGDKVVTAVGDWGLPAKAPFRMEFMVRFEKATVTFDGNGFTVFTNDEIQKPEIPAGDAYYNEIIDFMRQINQDTTETVNPPESSLLSLEIALAEKESAARGETLKTDVRR
jgi:predicted dehydrogenase